MVARPIVVLFLLAGPVLGQEPLITDRPDFTESAAVVDRGRTQIESGYTFTRSADIDQHALGEVLVRVGLGGGLELRLAPNSYAWVEGPDGDVDGFEDAGIGLKWLLADGDPGAAALLAGTSVPTGGDAFGAEGWQPEVTLALARGAVGANLGWGWADTGEGRRHTGLVSLAVGLPLGERLGVFLESYAIAAEGAGGEEAYADAGLTRLLSPDLQLDARVGMGLNDRAVDWFVGVGLARRW